MKNASTWQSLGSLAQRIACRLTARREDRIKEAVAPECSNSATASLPGREKATGGLKEGGLARPNHQREASAGRVRKATHASEEKPTLRREDAGENRRAGAGMFGLSKHASGVNEFRCAAPMPRAAETAKGPTPSHAVSAAPLG